MIVRPPLVPGASAEAVEQHTIDTNRYERLRRDRERDTLIDILGVIVMMIAIGVAVAASVAFGEHIFLWFLGTVVVAMFVGLCGVAVSIVRALFGMRE